MIREYEMLVDMVDKAEDWDDDSKINVESFSIYSTNEEDAYARCETRIEKEFPNKLYYIWDVNDDDVTDI